ncbi:MAG: protein phosphatase 2C domain-containing protein [Polyangiaceae bacterium]
MNIDTSPVSQKRPALVSISVQEALQTRASASTHPGNTRPVNEDHFLIANIRSAIQVVQASVRANEHYFGHDCASLFVVADGMGGHAGGERASALAVVSMETFILQSLSELGPMRETCAASLLSASFRCADSAVFDAGRERISLTGMGTTMTAALVVGNEVFLGHAGDSRAYLLRAGKLVRLTSDHTIASELLGKGILNTEEAEEHPLRNVVTNAIGGTVRGVTPDIRRFPARVGDKLLICTDGLSDVVSDEDLMRTLSEPNEPSLTSSRLVQAALDAGSKDNITALVVEFEAA